MACGSAAAHSLTEETSCGMRLRMVLRRCFSVMDPQRVPLCPSITLKYPYAIISSLICFCRNATCAAATTTKYNEIDEIRFTGTNRKIVPTCTYKPKP
eukprot:4910551-Pyramimonas_sp.AAC.2